jgi:chromosome segregation ATPase
MMEALADDLNTLTDAVPALTGAAADAIREAGELAQAADALLQEIADGRKQAAADLAAVREALPPLAAQAGSDAQRVEAAGDAAEKAWDDAREHLQEGARRLATHVEHVLTARTALQSSLAESGTRVDQSSARGEAALDRLEQVVTAAAAQLAAGAHAVDEEADELRTLMETARSSVAAACDELAKRLLQIGHRLEQDATRVLSELAADGKEHVDKVGGSVTGLFDTSEKGVHALDERAKAGTATPAEDAGQELHVELGRLGGTAAKCADLLQTRGEAVEQALARAEHGALPIPTGIEQIEIAARQVGL